MWIYTLQMSKWRTVPNSEFTLIDVTIKSPNDQCRRLFAPPSSKLVYDVKAGNITTGEYSIVYLEHLRRTSIEYYQQWLDFVKHGPDKVILMCYCSPGSFCHRHLLADYLERFGNAVGEPVVNFGEFSLDSLCDERIKYVYACD